MHPGLADLITVLQLERIEDDIFRGDSRDIGSAQVFGGQGLGKVVGTIHGALQHGSVLDVGLGDRQTTADGHGTQQSGKGSVEPRQRNDQHRRQP